MTKKELIEFLQNPEISDDTVIYTGNIMNTFPVYKSLIMYTSVSRDDKYIKLTYHD